MPSYASLLVLILAASTISPVLSADPPNVEGQAVESPPKKGLRFSTKVKLLLVTGLVGFSLWDWKKSTSAATKTQPTSETPPTNTTPVTSGTQPTNTTPVTSGTQPTNTAPVTSGTQPTNTAPVTSGTQPTNTAPVSSGTQPTNTAPVTSGTQPTNTAPAASGTSCTAANQQLIFEDLTTDPTRQTKPAQAIARREESSPGKYPPADIPAGHLEAGSFSKNIRRASSQLDLSNRADWKMANSLLSRMLDKLD